MRISNDTLLQSLFLSGGPPNSSHDENRTSQEVVVAIHVPRFSDFQLAAVTSSIDETKEIIFYRSVRDKNETFSSLCQSIVEHDLLERRQILHFLANLHPVLTEDCVEQNKHTNNSSIKNTLLSGYSLRYGQGFITIVKPTWKASLANSNHGQVQENYMEVNISLNIDSDPSKSESKAHYELNWYDPIISTVHRYPELFRDRTNQTNANFNLHHNPNDSKHVIHLYFRTITRIGKYGGPLFPATPVNARVLKLTEDDNHVGAVAWFENLSLAEAVDDMDADHSVDNVNGNGVSSATHVIDDGANNGELVTRSLRRRFYGGGFAQAILEGSRLDFTLDHSNYLFVEDRIERNEVFVGGVEERRGFEASGVADGAEDFRPQAQSSPTSNHATSNTVGNVTAQSIGFPTAECSHTAKATASNDKSANVVATDTASSKPKRKKRTNPTKKLLGVLAKGSIEDDSEKRDVKRLTSEATNVETANPSNERDKSNSNSKIAVGEKAKSAKTKNTARKSDAEANDKNISSGDMAQHQEHQQVQDHFHETEALQNKDVNGLTEKSKESGIRKDENASKTTNKGNLKSGTAAIVATDKLASCSVTNPSSSTANSEKNTKRKRKKAALNKEASNVSIVQSTQGDSEKPVALVIGNAHKFVAGNKADKLSSACNNNITNACIKSAKQYTANKSNANEHALNSTDIRQLAEELANQENLAHDSFLDVGLDKSHPDKGINKRRARISKQESIKPAGESKAKPTKLSGSNKRDDSDSGKSKNSNADHAAASPAKSHSPKKSGKFAATPSKTAEGFPEGWETRSVKRAGGSKSDRFWFSPINNYQFRSSKDALEFLGHLESCGGKEAVAWTLFTEAKKRKGKNQGNSEKSKNKETKEEGKEKKRAVSIDASENSLPPDGKNSAPPDKKKLKFNPVPKPKSLAEKKEHPTSQSDLLGRMETEGDGTTLPDRKGKKKTANQKKSNHDETKPKRPLTSYIRFANKIRPQVNKDNPGLTNKEVISKIGELWRNLGAEERKPFEDEAHEANARYLEAIKEYNTVKSTFTDENHSLV